MEVEQVKGLLSLLLATGDMREHRRPLGSYIQLRLIGGKHDSAYLDEKVREVKQYFPASRADVVPYRTTPRGGSQSVVLRFRLSSDRLRPVFNLLYPNGSERCITPAVLNFCGRKAAAWFWAENSKFQSDGSALLRRVGLLQEEAELMRLWLQGICNARSTVVRQKGRFFLHVPSREAKRAAEALRHVAPQSRRRSHFIRYLHHVEPSPLHQPGALLLPRNGRAASARAQAAPLARDPAP